jgi:drug/metabolite transporter (DMT)-like permease
MTWVLLSILTALCESLKVFILITSPIMVGEWPNFWGVVGVLFIVAGSYVLNLGERQRGYFAPFRALLQERGPRLMLITAFFWSIATSVFVAFLLFPIMLHKLRREVKQIPRRLQALAPIGFFDALTAIFQMTAISLTLVAHVIAIKRTSTIMSVLWGFLIFKEAGFKERLVGASIMGVGVLLISLF